MGQLSDMKTWVCTYFKWSEILNLYTREETHTQNNGHRIRRQVN